MHAAIAAGFRSEPHYPVDQARILWRLDSDNPHRPLLYVSSPARPDFTHITEQAGWPTLPNGWRCLPYRPMLDQIRTGATFSFRLVANPVHYGRLEPGAQTQRYGHVTVLQQEKWLLDHSAGWGFEITTNSIGENELAVTGRDRLSFQRESKRVTIATARFEGRLRVVESGAFLRSLLIGMGKAKAYGCGLMTLTPITGHAKTIG